MADEAEANKATLPGAAIAFVPGGDLPVGHIVGEYRIDAVAGRGGMGVVYSATQPVIEKRVAIKVLNAQYSADPALVRRFTDEARAVNRIRHPNIIDIFSFGQLADARQYFVMEFLEGSTLGARLDAGTLSLEEVPLLLGQICDALDAAHAENIVHRDLKPENIWIATPRRGRPFVKLLDFGIAKLMAVAGQSSTQTGAVMGTPHYMSPEQCHGRAVDHRTDIYALGVILYRLYAGRLPFEGETFMEVLTKQVTIPPAAPSTHAPSIPSALDRLILRCLAKEPGDRPQSGGEVERELATIFSSSSAPIAVGTTPVLGVSTTLSSGAVEIGGGHKASQGSRGSPASRESPASGGEGRGRLWAGIAIAGAVAVAVIVGVVAGHRGAPTASVVVAGPASASAAAGGPSGSPAAPAAPAPKPVAALPLPAPTPPAIEAPAATKKRRSAATKAAGNAADEPLRAPKAAHPRATDTGLVKDNPFQ
jgi:eukaryotic-like serine/threonine-protein kinase